MLDGSCQGAIITLNPPQTETTTMATISYLTTVQFDHGAIKLIGQECKRLGISRPLIITDKGIRASGLLDRLRENLAPEFGFEVFDDTPANPTEAAVLQALSHYRGVSTNGIIAMGGGSSLDLGKAVALLATHAGPLIQYAAVEGGAPKITSAVAPLIAIPRPREPAARWDAARSSCSTTDANWVSCHPICYPKSRCAIRS